MLALPGTAEGCKGAQGAEWQRIKSGIGDGERVCSLSLPIGPRCRLLETRGYCNIPQERGRGRSAGVPIVGRKRYILMLSKASNTSASCLIHISQLVVREADSAIKLQPLLILFFHHLMPFQLLGKIYISWTFVPCLRQPLRRQPEANVSTTAAPAICTTSVRKPRV